LLGLILILSGITTIFDKAFTPIRKFASRGDSFRLFLCIGCLSGVLLMLIHALAEINFHIPGNVFNFLFLLGLLTRMI
jgi:hypothetical protein